MPITRAINLPESFLWFQAVFIHQTWGQQMLAVWAQQMGDTGKPDIASICTFFAYFGVVPKSHIWENWDLPCRKKKKTCALESENFGSKPWHRHLFVLRYDTAPECLHLGNKINSIWPFWAYRTISWDDIGKRSNRVFGVNIHKVVVKMNVQLLKYISPETLLKWGTRKRWKIVQRTQESEGTGSWGLERRIIVALFLAPKRYYFD